MQKQRIHCQTMKAEQKGAQHEAQSRQDTAKGTSAAAFSMKQCSAGRVPHISPKLPAQHFHGGNQALAEACLQIAAVVTVPLLLTGSLAAGQPRALVTAGAPPQTPAQTQTRLQGQQMGTQQQQQPCSCQQAAWQCRGTVRSFIGAPCYTTTIASVCTHCGKNDSSAVCPLN